MHWEYLKWMHYTFSTCNRSGRVFLHFGNVKVCRCGITHAQKQALVFLDGAQASEEARHHDDGAYGDDHVGSREGREGGGEGGEAALRHRQPDSNSQQPTATQLQRETTDYEILMYSGTSIQRESCRSEKHHSLCTTKINWNVAFHPVQTFVDVYRGPMEEIIRRIVRLILILFSTPIGSTRGRTHHANFVPWGPHRHFWWNTDCPLTFVCRQESSCVTALAYL